MPPDWLKPSYEDVLRQLDACLGMMEIEHVKRQKHGLNEMCPLARTSCRISTLAHQNPAWILPGLFYEGGAQWGSRS